MSGSPARKVPAASGNPEFSPQPLFALERRLVYSNGYPPGHSEWQGRAAFRGHDGQQVRGHIRPRPSMSNPSGEQRPQATPPTDSSQVWFGPIEGPPPRTPAEEAAHQLDILRRELNYYAQHLRKARQTQLGHYEQLGLISGQQTEREQRLRRQETQMAADRAALEQDRRRHEEQLAADRAALERQRQELDQQARQAQERQNAEQARVDRLREEFEQKQRVTEETWTSERTIFEQARAATEQQQKAERERWATEHAQQLADLNRGAEKLAQEKKDLAWSEAALNKQRDQLQKLRAELADLQQANQAKDDSEKAGLRQELEALRQQLADQDLRLVDKDQQLAERDQLLSAARAKLDRETANFQQYEADLRNEMAALRRQLEEKRVAVSPLPVTPAPAPEPAIPKTPVVEVRSPLERLAPAPRFEPEPEPEAEAPEEIAAAMGLEEAIAAREAEEADAERPEVEPAEVEEPAAIKEEEPESEALEPAAIGSVTVKADEFSGPLDFENGALVLESVRGLIRADRRRVEEELLVLQARKGSPSGPAPAAAVEKAPLSDRRAQLERLRDEMREDLARLAQEAAAREPQRPPQQSAKPQANKPGPTKTRGTFMGLRRWLGG
jgi:hypothetical protein